MSQPLPVKFYHAGCPVCVDAEQTVAKALDPQRYTVDIIHLGERGELIQTASKEGVQSVPAMVIAGQAFHINHGADLSALTA